MKHYTSIRTYGMERQQELYPHLILLAPHGASPTHLQKTDPALLTKIHRAAQSSGVDPKLLDEFIRIESDCLSFEVVEAVANNLRQRIDGIRIEVIEVWLPRALIDMNRTLEHSIGKSFNHEDHPELVREMEAVYQRTLIDLRKAISRLAKTTDIDPSGTLMEIHTMGPVTPEHIPVSPETLEQRVTVWKELTGEERRIDIIDLVEDHQGNRELFGDQEISRELQRQFGERATRNDPYFCRPELLSHTWSELVDSHIVVDIPKHELTKEHPHDNGAFCLEKLQGDHRRIHDMADDIAQVLVRVLERRLRVTST